MAATVKIQGADRLIRRLNELQRRRIKPITRAALREGANVIRDAARQDLRARGYSRGTYNAPIVRVQRDPGPTLRRMLITYKLDAYWLIFIEQGTSPKKVTARNAEVLGFKRGGEWITFGERGVAGATPARPWFRPAFDQNKGKAVRVFADALERRIAEELVKIAGS